MKRDSLANTLSIGFLTGLVMGQVFLIVGIVVHDADFMRMSPSLDYAVWVLLRSVATYGLLAACIGLVFGATFHGICRFLGRGFSLALPLLLGIAVSTTILSYLTEWRQLSVLAGLPLSHPARLPAAAFDTGISFVAGAAAGTIALLTRPPLERRWPVVRLGRLACLAVVATVLTFAVAEFALRLENPENDRPWQPSQVVVVGLDAVTFRVMGPMLRAGELPAFARLIQEGAWGTYLTYGAASSPMVWTSMATGKRVRDHGINDFVALVRGSQRAEPLKSYDRRVKALWNILSDFGLTVAVVDWIVTFPPEEVNGYVVTRLHTKEQNRTYPPELNKELESILASSKDYGDPYRNRNLNRIDHVFATARLLLDKQHIDALLMYDRVTDHVQHRYWKYYEPHRFDPEVWSFSDQDQEQLSGLIQETYTHIDRRLGELVNQLDEDALLIVVSDHGQLAANRPEIWFNLDHLLATLGAVEFVDQNSDRVNFRDSVAYSAVVTPWLPTMGVNINLKGREPNGIVDPEEADELIQELASKLRAIDFEGGEPLLGPVYAIDRSTSKGSSSSDPDIAVMHSPFTRTHKFGDRNIVVEGRTYQLSEFLQDTGLSGRHDRQGVIFIRGKGVRRGQIGQRVISTPIQSLIRPLPDKVDAIDTFLPLLRQVGLIERAKTLDLTPTILYAFGLPIGDDMAGRILSDVIDTGRTPERRASYETGVRESARPPSTLVESDEEVLEQLKTLGYVN